MNIINLQTGVVMDAVTHEIIRPGNPSLYDQLKGINDRLDSMNKRFMSDLASLENRLDDRIGDVGRAVDEIQLDEREDLNLEDRFGIIYNKCDDIGMRLIGDLAQMNKVVKKSDQNNNQLVSELKEIKSSLSRLEKRRSSFNSNVLRAAEEIKGEEAETKEAKPTPAKRKRKAAPTGTVASVAQRSAHGQIMF